MYGHDAGDTVLCETARRLLSIVRGADTVVVGHDAAALLAAADSAMYVVKKAHQRGKRELSEV